MFRRLKDSRYPKNALAGATALVALMAMVPLVMTHHKSATVASESQKDAKAADSKAAKTALGKLPMSFEPNVGQTVAGVKYVARGRKYNVFLTDHEAVLNLKKTDGTTKDITVDLVGGQPTGTQTADLQKGYSNYYVGPKSQWHEKVPSYGSVEYTGVYKGVDTVFRGDDGNLRYDYVVHAGGDTGRIRMAFRGIDAPKLGANGDLELEAGLTQRKPYIYQEVNGKKQEVAGGYKMLAGNQVGFEIGNYDKSRDLVIDPTLYYGSYLGGANVDAINAVTIDGTYMYLVGTTNSVAFPSGVAGSKPGSASFDAYVILLPRTGGAGTFLWRTFFGGTGIDTARAIALGQTGGAQGAIYVAGDSQPSTVAVGFSSLNNTFGGVQTAVPAPAIQGTAPSGGGQNAWLMVLGVGGVMSATESTFVGQTATATTYGYAVVANNTGDVWIGGSTNDSAIGTSLGLSTQDTYLGGASDGYIQKYNVATLAGAVNLLGATYVGGIGTDSVTALTSEAGGGGTTTIIATGSSTSDSTSAFPVTAGAFQLNNAGCPTTPGGCTPTNPSSTSDAFVVALNGGVTNTAGLRGAPLFGTFVGGPGNDAATGIALDPVASGQNIYITGNSSSAVYGPASVAITGLNGTVAGAGSLPFAAKLGPTAATVAYYDEFLGVNDTATGIVVDALNHAYIVGTTSQAAAVPQSVGANPFTNANPQGPSDAFLVRIGQTGTATNFVGFDGGAGTEVGNGIALDTVGSAPSGLIGDLFIVGNSNGNGATVTTGAGGTAVAFQSTNQNPSPNSTDGIIANVTFNDMYNGPAPSIKPAANTLAYTITGGVLGAAPAICPAFLCTLNFTNTAVPTVGMTVSAVTYTGGSTYNNTPASNWLNAIVYTGAVTPTTSTLSITTTAGALALAPGNYTATFTLTGLYDNGPQTFTINLAVKSVFTATPGNYVRTFTKSGPALFGSSAATAIPAGQTALANVGGTNNGANSDIFNVNTNATGQTFTAAVTALNQGGAGTVACPTTFISAVTPLTVTSGANNFTVAYSNTVLEGLDMTTLAVNGAGLPKCTATITFTSPGATTTPATIVEIDIQSRIVTYQSFPQAAGVAPNPTPSAAKPLDPFNFDIPSNIGISKTLTVLGDGLSFGYTATITTPFISVLGANVGAQCTLVGPPPVPLTLTPISGTSGNPAQDANTLAPASVSSVVFTANSVGCQSGNVYQAVVTFTSNTVGLTPNVVVTVTMNVGNILTVTPNSVSNGIPVAILPNTISTDTSLVAETTGFTISGNNFNQSIPNGNASNTGFNFTVSVATTLLAGPVSCGVIGNPTANWVTLTSLGSTTNGVTPFTETLTMNSAVWAALPSAPSNVGGCTYTALITVTPTPTGSQDVPYVAPGGTNTLYVDFSKITQAISASATSNVPPPAIINLVGQVGGGVVTANTNPASNTAPFAVPTNNGLGFTASGSTAAGPTVGLGYLGFAAPALYTAGTNPSGWEFLGCGGSAAAAINAAVIPPTASPYTTCVPNTAGGTIFTVAANTQNLAASPIVGGQPIPYTGLITYNGGPAGGDFTGQVQNTSAVNLYVLPAASFSLSSTTTQAYNFVVTPGAAAPTALPLTLQANTLSFASLVGGLPTFSSTILAGVSYTITTPNDPLCNGVPFFTVAPIGSQVSGAAATPLTVSFPPACLSAAGAGNYTGTISVQSSVAGVPVVTVPVSLTVTVPSISASTSTVTFNTTVGAASDAAPQTVTVTTNPNGLVVTATANVITPVGGNWLGCSVLNGTLTISTTRGALLSNGSPYTGNCTLSTPGGTNVVVPVVFNVAAAVINASNSQVNFGSYINTPDPASQNVPVTTTPAGQVVTPAIAYLQGAGWLTAVINNNVLTLTASKGALIAGTYNANVTLSSTGATNVVIPVQFIVSSPVINAPAPAGGLSFNTTVGGPDAAPQTITVTTTPAVLNVGVTATPTQNNGAGTWLTASLSGSGTLTVTAVKGTNLTGTLTGFVTLSAPGATNVIINVSLTINPPVIIAPLSTLTFSAAIGGPNPTPQTVPVSTNPAGLTITPSVVYGVGSGWLGTPTIANGVLTVSPILAGLTAQTYSASINLTTPGLASPVTIPVTFVVSAQPTISIANPALTFAYTIGAPLTNPTNPANQTTLVTVGGPTAIPLSLGTITGTGSTAISASLSTTVATNLATLTVIAVPNPGGTFLPVGTYTATIPITSPNVTTQNVTVTFTITAQPTFTFTTPGGGSGSNLSFVSTFGSGNTPASQQDSVATVQSGGPLAGLAVNGTISYNQAATGWLSFTQAGGTTPTLLTISVNPAPGGTALPPGTYTASINLSAPPALPASISITYVVNPQPVVTAATNAYGLTYTIGGSLVSNANTGAAQVLPLVDALGAQNIQQGSTLTLNAPALSCTGGNNFVSPSLTGITALNLGVSTAGLPAGSYTCTVTLSGQTSGILGAPTSASALSVVTVALTVLPVPVINSTPSGAMTFSSTFTSGANSTPAPQIITISASSVPAYWATAGLGVNATVTAGGAWLSVAPGSSVTPFPLTVTANPGTMAAGQYVGNILLSVASPFTAIGSTTTNITVTLNVVNSNAISVAIPSLSFNDVVGGTVAPYLPASVTDAVTVSDGGAAIPLTVTITGPNANLFVASLSTGNNPTTSSILTVGLAAPGSLPTTPNTYNATVTIASTTQVNVGVVNIPVSVTVAAAPVLTVATIPTFQSTVGGANPSAQTINATLTTSPFGLSFPISSVVTTGSAVFSISGNNLIATPPATAGTYNGSITVSSATGSGVVSQVVNVSLIVYPQPSITTGTPVLLSYTIGQVPGIVSGSVSITGNATAPGSTTVTNLALGTTNGTCSIFSSISLGSSSAPTSVTFTPVNAGLLNSTLPGVYTCTVPVSGSTTGTLGAPTSSPVALATASITVVAQPIINAVQTPVVLTSPNGVTSAQVIVTTTPVGLSVAVSSTVITPSGGTWLSASLSGSGATQTLLITANPAGLSKGTYTGSVTLTSGNGANFPAIPVTIPVSLLIQPAIEPSQLGVFRTGNTFLLDSNGNNQYDSSDLYITTFIPTGGFQTGDLPVAGDWTGSGHAKVGIYRPSTGTWYLDANGDGVLDTGDIITQFGGIAGDIPVVGDWSGSGTSKIGIFRQGFFWLLDTNGDGVFDNGDSAFAFGGIAGDVPVVGDWTGNGVAKVGVVRRYAPGGVPTGNPFFWVLDAQNNHTSGFITFPYGGLAGDVFVTGDWNGTGTAKPGIYRQGNWIESLSPSYTYDTFYQYGGLAGDIPLVGFKGYR